MKNSPAPQKDESRLGFLSSTLRKSNSGFFVAVATLLSGKGVEAVIGLLMLPIIARLFTPEDYGVVASLIAISAILMPVVTMSYEGGIVVARDERIARALSLTCILLGSVSAVIATFVIFYPGFQGMLISAGDLYKWLWLIPLYIFLRTLRRVTEQSAIRNAGYKRLAVAGVAEVSSNNLVRVFAGLRYGSEALILGLSYAFSLIVRAAICVRWGGARFYWGLKWVDFKEALSEFRQFPLYQMPGNLLKAATGNLPVVMLSGLFGPIPAGIYAMSLALVKRPLEKIQTSYRAVFMQRGSRLRDDPGKLYRFYKYHTGVLFLTFGPAFIVLFILSPKAFHLLLGDRWVDAGCYVQALLPWLFGLCLALPAAAVYVLVGAQNYWLRFTALGGLLQLSPFAIAFIYPLKEVEVILGYSLLGMAVSSLMMVHAGVLLRRISEQGA